MQFPQQFPFLVIPTGATSGQRIEINVGQNGEIDVYNSSGQLVNIIGGVNGSITAQDADGSAVTLSAGNGATVFLTPANLAGNTWLDGQVATTIGGGNHPAVEIVSPAEATTGFHSGITLEGSSKASNTTIILYAATTHSFTGDVNVFGDLNANNIQHGSVNVVFNNVSQVDTTVNFAQAFTNVPDATVSMKGIPAGSSALQIKIISISTTQIAVRIYDTGGTLRTLTQPFSYIAIG